MMKGRKTMAKKNPYQKSSLKNQEEIGQEIAPKNDQEASSEFSYNPPEQGMNKKQQQQKKQ
jgi:hypothetical protein